MKKLIKRILPSKIMFILSAYKNKELFLNRLIFHLIHRKYIIGYYLLSLKNRKYFKKRFYAFQNKIEQKLYPDGNIKILYGPFKDVKYFNKIVWGVITTKWIGSYEDELHEIINKIIKYKKYKTIIDIGSAEGYYTTGFASKLPDTNVFSFEIDPFARKMQQKLTNLNKLYNIKIGKECTFNTFSRLINNKTLIICDIEGEEYNLLNPKKAPSLLEADILVELHLLNGSIENMLEAIKTRFLKTHHVNIIKQEEKNITKYNQIINNKLSDTELMESIDEGRGFFQYWLWLEKKQ